MNTSLLVERFTLPQFQDEFQARQQATLQTLEAAGFGPDNILLTGTAALALHGIDAHLPRRVTRNWLGAGYDVDGLIPAKEAFRLKDTAGVASRLSEGGCVLPAGISGNSLPLTAVIVPQWAEEKRSGIVYGDGGIATLPVGLIALRKVGRGQVKDLGGLLKAQYLLFANRHPVLADFGWRMAIGIAMERVRTGAIERGSELVRRHWLPGWMKQLRACGFDHPAFDRINIYGTLDAGGQLDDVVS